MKSLKNIYALPFFQVSGKKMGDFKFLIESDAWMVLFVSGHFTLHISCEIYPRYPSINLIGTVVSTY